MVRFGICDDDRKFALGFCAVLLEYLKKLYGTGIECECKTYSSGEELLENYKADQIDIVFMDIEVGDESGFAIAKKLISIEEDMGIVYVTNYECYISDAFVCRPLGFVRKAKVEKDIERTLVSVIEYAEKKKERLGSIMGRKFMIYWQVISV